MFNLVTIRVIGHVVYGFSQLDVTLEIIRSDPSTSGSRCRLTRGIIPFDLLHSILWMRNGRFLYRLQDFNTRHPCPALLVAAASTQALLRDAPIVLFLGFFPKAFESQVPKRVMSVNIIYVMAEK